MEEKKLSLSQALALGLGNIIGAGIFVMAGVSITAAGPAALLAFLITAVYAMSVGLNNAELASVFPKVEGGVYSFALLSLGETIGFLVGWFRVIGYAISGGATALGFSGYLITTFSLPSFLYFPLAILLIIVLIIIDYLGLKLAAEIESILVVLNILGLVTFSITALVISGIRLQNFSPFFPHGITRVLTASNIAFFAYSGFNTIATLTPSVKEGERTVPKAIVLSLLISAFLYMLVTFSMVDAIGYTNFKTNSAPLQLVLNTIHAPFYVYFFVNLTAILATITVTLSTIIATERTMVQMELDNLLPKVKGGKLSILLIIGLIMIASLGLGNVEVIALVSNFGVVFSYMLSGIEVAVVRHRGLRGVFKSPGFPFVQIVSVILSGVFIYSLGFQSLLIGFVTLLIGLVTHSVHKEIMKKEGIFTRRN
ncbi:APC family permease [Sulfurisphaera ohwakuensis]|uniref:APA family basic amino acid/polyamine antiporter n=1 Tax=Sulfurisphaera ohwakuensis TaxID=69656 RepID=A0A650CFK9_SULOH|nr:APC family permease [Sulfurisphaera ohwakuensis]MBB5255038.1 APA family basic amino acid/polyamine antiporter [Sulfurisphaera ohwakuensis]QGR16572.1 amino acid permease [Sulfurisphaera ohwakuensis]